jgi:hypothetical protein
VAALGWLSAQERPLQLRADSRLVLTPVTVHDEHGSGGRYHRLRVEVIPPDGFKVRANARPGYLAPGL